MPTRYYLAYDGGNSKTDVLVGTDDGQVCSYLRGPCCLHHSVAWPESVRRLCHLASRALRAAGLPESATVTHAQLFLAGINEPAQRDWFTTALAATFGASVAVDNDAFAVLRAGGGATPNASAVAVVCGAGLNCVGRHASGRTAQYRALGALSGDWGSGPDLGLTALAEAVRGEDGRGRPTRLGSLIAAWFGLPTASAVAVSMHSNQLSRDRLTELVPVLFDAAGTGDDVACAVLDRLAAEIATMVAGIAKRLQLSGRLPVVLAGGVLTNAPPALHSSIAERIAAPLPEARTELLDRPPVVGAALAALDALGAGPGAYLRLGAGLTELAVPHGVRFRQ